MRGIQMWRLMPAGLICFMLLSAASIAGQDDPAAHWGPLLYFEGRWEGTATGAVGEGQVEREYRFVLRGAYLRVENRSTYPPQERNPRGEVHEDVGFISYDRARARFALRQFHVETFVNTYIADPLSAGARTVVFTSEAIENVPPGYRARETYEIIDEDTFIERFEIAEPGQDFSLYTSNTLHRVR